MFFDLTQWASPDASFYSAWRPGTSQIFLYSTYFVPYIPGYTLLLNIDNGQICNIDLGKTTLGQSWAGVARWSPNGRYLAVVRAVWTVPIDHSDLAVLDTATGKLYTMDVTPSDEKGLHFVDDIAWAPDNHHILVVGSVTSINQCGPNCWKDTRLYLVDFISGQNILLLPAYQFSTGWWGTNLAWSPDGSKLLINCPANDILKLCLISVQKVTK